MLYCLIRFPLVSVVVFFGLILSVFHYIILSDSHVLTFLLLLLVYLLLLLIFLLLLLLLLLPSLSFTVTVSSASYKASCLSTAIAHTNTFTKTTTIFLLLTTAVCCYFIFSRKSNSFKNIL